MMQSHAPSAPIQPIADDAALNTLRSSLRGELIRREDNEYDTIRSIWNGMIDRRPALIARCLGVADVRAALSFARAHQLAVSVRGGGHNIAGLAVSDGSMMIDLSRMRGVRVDPSSRTAHAQAGCLLSDVDRETQVHGLAAVLGFVSTTGIAGLTLGGGFGYLTRRFGWTSDTVRSMEVVTADGDVVQASDDVNPDLFWATAGGNPTDLQCAAPDKSASNNCFTGAYAGAYTTAEQAYIPGYTCATTATGNLDWESVTQTDLGAELESFHLTSLMCDTYGDEARLYSVALWVR